MLQSMLEEDPAVRYLERTVVMLGDYLEISIVVAAAAVIWMPGYRGFLE